MAFYSVLTIEIFQTFLMNFIDKNPQVFLDFEWINVPKLKIFIESKFNMYYFYLELKTKCIDGIGISFGSRVIIDMVPIKT